MNMETEVVVHLALDIIVEIPIQIEETTEATD